MAPALGEDAAAGTVVTVDEDAARREREPGGAERRKRGQLP
jgi:hypothetical protein